MMDIKWQWKINNRIFIDWYFKGRRKILREKIGAELQLTKVEFFHNPIRDYRIFSVFIRWISKE